MNKKELQFSIHEVEIKSERRTAMEVLADPPKLFNEETECSGIYAQSAREKSQCKKLRERCIKEIESINKKQAVADYLGLAPGGVDALLWEPEWSLELAYRVAYHLGLEPHISTID